MAELTTIARPYAQAAFATARDQNNLLGWSQALERVAQVICDPQLRSLISHPRIQAEQLSTLILEMGQSPDPMFSNFVRVLAESRRLNVFTQIAELFELYRAEAERTQKVEVRSAFALTSEQQARIAAAMKKRLGREVLLEVEVDPSLVGGVVIRAGDQVVDGTVGAQLQRLAQALAR